MNDVEKSIKSDMQKQYKKELKTALKSGDTGKIVNAALRYEVAGQADQKVVKNDNLEIKNTLGVIKDLGNSSKMNAEEFQKAMQSALKDSVMLEKALNQVTRLFRTQMIQGSANANEISEYSVIEENQFKLRNAYANSKTLGDEEYNRILKQVRTEIANSMRNGADRIVKMFFNENDFIAMSNAFSEEIGIQEGYIEDSIQIISDHTPIKKASEINQNNISDEIDEMKQQVSDISQLLDSVSELKDMLSPAQYKTSIEEFTEGEGLDLDEAIQRVAAIKNAYNELV